MRQFLDRVWNFSRGGGRPWWLLLMLGSLHLALLAPQPDSAPTRMLMLGHLGALLAWQPLIDGERTLSGRELALGAVAVVALLYALSWGLLLLWVLALAGILGGKVFQQSNSRSRLPYWLALTYLVLALLLCVLPALLPHDASLPPGLTSLFRFGGPLLLVLMLAFPAREPARRGPEAMDFIGSLVLFLVLAGVAMGALALMFLAQLSYAAALLRVLAVMAGALLLLAWAWSPREGFAGLGLAISRYALSGGVPFERWLAEVADLSLREPDPDAFVAAALSRADDWPGLRGLLWRGDGGEPVLVGRHALRRAQIRHGELEIELQFDRPLGSTLLWQIDLMIRLLAEFHAAKRQARRLEALSYLRAVHETGARLTHEVKNLLQSLDTLCFAVSAGGAGRSEQALALVERQLPEISRRLHDTMARLRAPTPQAERWISAGQWWRELLARHGAAAVRFERELEDAQTLPATLFDTVADNLLRNAADKAASTPGLGVWLRLGAGDGGACLQVCDDGAAIPVERLRGLLQAPLASPHGLGIGLYQAAQMAQARGFLLRLAENRDGRVCFTLAPVTAEPD